MKTSTTSKWLLFYHIMVSFFVFLSAGLALTIMFSPSVSPWVHQLNTSVWVIFVIDYLVRLLRTPNRKWFLVDNILDLIGIIPMHPVFALFRLSRLMRIIKVHHIIWHLGISGKWSRSFHRFLYDTGFIYLITISVVIICVSAWLFSIVEHQSLSQAMWWAVTTATTVGYGDDFPKTGLGKVIATALMFGGVGFIGLLTSQITEFFTDRATVTTTNEPTMQDLSNQIQMLTKEVRRLQRKVDRQSAGVKPKTKVKPKPKGKPKPKPAPKPKTGSKTPAKAKR